MLLQETYSDPPTGKARSAVRQLDRGYHVQQFRFIPDSYFKAVGSVLDVGTEGLVYLRLFIEEETEDEF